MSADTLMDTGTILALLDKTDPWHATCGDTFRRLRLPLVTSEAVLTGLSHLVGDNRHEVETAWKFVRSGAVRVAVIEDSELPEIQTLMSRYWDCPMDFADATLVYLARREHLPNVFTIDHSDFNTYRIEGRKRFRVVRSSK